MKSRNLMILGTAFAMGLPTAAARADVHNEVQTLLVRNGNDAGPYRIEDGRDQPLQDAYPGGEQSQLAQLATGEVLIFGMGSYRLNGALPNNRNQMFCAEITMDAQQGPRVTQLKYVTNNNGDRYRNAHHPRATSIFGGEAVAVQYNYAENNHAEVYMMVFGKGCEMLSNRQKIVAKNNDNCASSGAQPDTVFYQDATKAKLFGAYGCNGNGEDDSWASVNEIVKTGGTGTATYQVNAITDDIRTENEEERTRPDVVPTVDGTYEVVCLSAGNTQPPNRGIYCSAYDTTTFQRLWRMPVALRDNGIYRTQVRASVITDSLGKPTGRAYLNWTEIAEQRRRGKGSAKMVSQVISFDRNGMTLEGTPQYDVFIGGDATHGSICNTQWGVDGAVESRMVMLSQSINGSPGGYASAEIIKFDDIQKKMVGERKVGLNAAIDSGWLSNLYGQNPNTQGRNFTKCLGNVRNPGYGLPTGYMKNVKTFVAVSAHTRRMDVLTGNPEQKLATELVLMPAVVAPESPDPDPTPEPEPDPTNPEPEPDPTDPTPDPTDPGPGAGVGGCSTGNGAAGMGTLAMLGIALAFTIRRRK
jgi:MYXO-CTERM domain-containing protein